MLLSGWRKLFQSTHKTSEISADKNVPIRDEDVPARIMHDFMTREPTEYELWYDSLSEEDKEAKHQFFKAPGAEYSALEAKLWEAWDQILNSDQFEGTLRACDDCDAAGLKLEQYCLSQGYGAVLHFESRWLRMHNSQHPKHSVYDRSDRARQEASENVQIRDLLLGLLADGPQLQKDIPHILGIERPAVMRVLKLLEGQGYISRTKHQRTYEVALRVYDRPNGRE
ncbi:MAG: hypothetical protein QM296_02475 [Bacillota bacterium]|nr:hypothetical protein [Bacillota bacterium]